MSAPNTDNAGMKYLRIASFAALCFMLFFAEYSGLFAVGGTSALKTELEKARATAMRKDIPPREQHDAWLRLGRLLHLSGDMESAAEVWVKAAYAEKGNRDDNALLGAVACYIALGEWEKAEAGTKLVLVTTQEKSPVLVKAKYLSAQIEAFRTGDISILNALLENNDYAPFRSGIYWTLWKITGSADYRRALLALYPDSPETQILSGEKSAVMELVTPNLLIGAQ